MSCAILILWILLCCSKFYRRCVFNLIMITWKVFDLFDGKMIVSRYALLKDLDLTIGTTIIVFVKLQSWNLPLQKY